MMRLIALVLLPVVGGLAHLVLAMTVAAESSPTLEGDAAPRVKDPAGDGSADVRGEPPGWAPWVVGLIWCSAACEALVLAWPYLG